MLPRSRGFAKDASPRGVADCAAMNATTWRQPAEWAAHRACWMGWPGHDWWDPHRAETEAAFVALVRAIAEGEAVHVLARAEWVDAARAALAGAATVHPARVGDVWLRDTAPIFVAGPDGPAAATFRFNGWGGKYLYAGDTEVAAQVAALSGLPAVDHPFTLEGGGVDVDGEGTALTTRECLLNPNRGGADEAVWAERLRASLGIERVLWLDEGLAFDHTDGHVDGVARFTAPGVAVRVASSGPGDPHHARLEAIARALTDVTDARGRTLEVVPLPSPGAVRAPDGEIMPASYANFYIANHAVIVPVFGAPTDDAACGVLRDLFPGRRVVPLDARAIVVGGGAFHCTTQQQPEFDADA